jgi:hypothetical protein
MGCQLKAYGADLELNWSCASYAVMGLANRWLDKNREMDEPGGWYQSEIHETSIANLNAEAPHEMAEFRAYCAMHLGEKDAAELDDRDLEAMREFIAKAHEAGKGVWCSY